jgi:serine/threonine-protein kinase HipA
MNYNGQNGEYFEVIDVVIDNCDVLKTSKPNELSLLWFNSNGNSVVERITVIGLLGKYILKPQTERYEQLPEIED